MTDINNNVDVKDVKQEDVENTETEIREELETLKQEEIDKVLASSEETLDKVNAEMDELVDEAELAKVKTDEVRKDIDGNVINDVEADVASINADREDLIDKTKKMTDQAVEAVESAFDTLMENESVQQMAAKADDVVSSVRGSEAYQGFTRKTDEVIESLKNNEELQNGIAKTKDATFKFLDDVVEGTKQGAQFVKDKTIEVVNSDEFNEAVDKAKDVATDVGHKIGDAVKSIFKK